MKALRRKTGTLHQFNTDIPVSYNKKMIRVLPCNPSQLYVYWEIPEQENKGFLALQVSAVIPQNDETEVISRTPLKIGIQSCYITITVEMIRYLIEIVRLEKNSVSAVLCCAEYIPRSLNNRLTGEIPAFLSELNDKDSSTLFNESEHTLPIVSVSFHYKPQQGESQQTIPFQKEISATALSSSPSSSWIYK